MKRFIKKPIRQGLTIPSASITVSICILSITLLACNGQKKPAMENEVVKSQAQTNSPLILVLEDNYAGTDSEETLVIKNEKSLRSFFSKINKTRKPGIPVPVVDFSKETILVYCAGEQQNNGMPRLTIVDETDTEMTLQMGSETIKNAKSTSATISPFSMYKMSSTSKSIVFKAIK